jgi:hypothetical protein
LIDRFTRQEIGRQLLTVMVTPATYVMSADEDQSRHGATSTLTRKLWPGRAVASLASIFSALGIAFGLAPSHKHQSHDAVIRVYD